MGLIRTDKASGEFFIGHKGWAEDERLSWQARGLLAYLFAKPDDWEVRMTDLVRSGPCKKHKVRSMMRELIEYGYAEREKQRNEDDGTFTWVTTIRERPPRTQSRMDSIHDGSDRGYTKEPSSTNNKEEGSSGHARAREPAEMPDALLPIYEVYEEDVNALLEAYFPEEADKLLYNTWGRAQRSTLRLAKEFEWPYFVAGVVIAQHEADHPNPRYLKKLLTALTSLDEHTTDDPTKDEQQSNLQRLWDAAREA